MSAPHANAASARSPSARIPAARPSSGPRSAIASRASSTPSGSGGSSWPGAADDDDGRRRHGERLRDVHDEGDPAQSMSAFGSPMRLDRPPASTIPARRAPRVSGCRWSPLPARAPLRLGGRRSADDVPPDAQTRRRQKRIEQPARRGGIGWGRFGWWLGRNASYRSDARPERTECVGAWRRRVGGCWAREPSPFPHELVKRCPRFPQPGRRNVRQVRALARAASTGFARFPHDSPQARLRRL